VWGGAEPGGRAGEPLGDRGPGARADADVQEVALGEVPAVALEVGLGEQLGRAVAAREGAQEGGADPGLALLGHDHVPVRATAAEGAGHRTAVPTRADDHRRLPRAGVARQKDATGNGAYLPRTRVLDHLHPGVLRAAEEEGVELGAHDTEARRTVPARLVLLRADGERHRGERLDGVRVGGR